MPHPLINFLVLLVVLCLLGGSLVFSPKGRTWWNQKTTDRKRRRAHAGKVICEDADCDSVAVMLTPHGYFCEWHWGPMSIKKLPNGGQVTWSHALYHAVRRS